MNLSGKRIKNLYKKIINKPHRKPLFDNLKSQLNNLEKEEILKWKHISKLRIKQRGRSVIASFFNNTKKKSPKKTRFLKLKKNLEESPKNRVKS